MSFAEIIKTFLVGIFFDTLVLFVSGLIVFIIFDIAIIIGKITKKKIGLKSLKLRITYWPVLVISGSISYILVILVFTEHFPSINEYFSIGLCGTVGSLIITLFLGVLIWTTYKVIIRGIKSAFYKYHEFKKQAVKEYGNRLDLYLYTFLYLLSGGVFFIVTETKIICLLYGSD
jgi:hypothetical protein